MMKDYALYYSYKGIGDVLVIVFDNALPTTRSERIGNVVALYNEDKLIGCNIFDIKEIIKIKSSGLIYYPSEQFLSVINSMLKNAKLPTLELKENSGYFIGEVKEINNGIITLNDGVAYLKEHNLKVGDKVVYAKVGTYLNNGQVVKEENKDGVVINSHICTNKELGINEEETILVLDEDEQVGLDFFSLEENL